VPSPPLPSDEPSPPALTGSLLEPQPPCRMREIRRPRWAQGRRRVVIDFQLRKKEGSV
jgi:hypothetical protein